MRSAWRWCARLQSTWHWARDVAHYEKNKDVRARRGKKGLKPFSIPLDQPFLSALLSLPCPFHCRGSPFISEQLRFVLMNHQRVKYRGLCTAYFFTQAFYSSLRKMPQGKCGSFWSSAMWGKWSDICVKGCQQDAVFGRYLGNCFAALQLCTSAVLLLARE